MLAHSQAVGLAGEKLGLRLASILFWKFCQFTLSPLSYTHVSLEVVEKSVSLKTDGSLSFPIIEETIKNQPTLWSDR